MRNTLTLFIGGVPPMQAIAQTTHSAVEQQTTAVTGVVTDATGPVIGASVIEKEIRPMVPSPT